MATYPNAPSLPAVTSSTPVDSSWGNSVVDNINAIGQDLVNARGDGQDFPGTDHAPGQASNLDEILQAIKHMLSDISGEQNWYDAPQASLRSHDHSLGKGGLIPWSSIGSSSARKIELHPIYPGYVQTNSLRGADPSGSNNITLTTGEEVVSYNVRHFFQATSSEPSLQDTFISIKLTLPKDFASWNETNAIQLEFKTSNALSTNNAVSIFVYKSGSSDVVASSAGNANTTWSMITIGGQALGNWEPDEMVELYLKLESRSNNYVRIGRLVLNYES